jgi:hypothetical protein
MLAPLADFFGEDMITFGFRARILFALAFASFAVSAAAADLPALPAGLTALSKSVHVPAFNLATPAGGTVREDEFHGKVLIARFWATW